MKKLKQLTKFTLKEYYEYSRIINQEEVDMSELLELFGVDINSTTMDEYNNIQDEILQMKINKKLKLKLTYKIGDMRFSVCNNLTKLKAGQFIDLQNYIVENKLEEILSVFLIPQKKSFLSWKDNKYAEDYDMLEVQKCILNNMLIEDVNFLSDFFLRQYIQLSKVTNQYLQKKVTKMKVKMIKKQTNQISQN